MRETCYSYLSPDTMSRTHINTSGKIYDRETHTFAGAAEAAAEIFHDEFPNHEITNLTVEMGDDGLFEYNIRGE